MADGSKLVLTFENQDGGDTVFSFPYAKASPTLSQVRNLADVIIANGNIFSEVPTRKKAARVIKVSETSYDISD